MDVKYDSGFLNYLKQEGTLGSNEDKALLEEIRVYIAEQNVKFLNLYACKQENAYLQDDTDINLEVDARDVKGKALEISKTLEGNLLTLAKSLNPDFEDKNGGTILQFTLDPESSVIKIRLHTWYEECVRLTDKKFPNNDWAYWLKLNDGGCSFP